jgi:hypothetical protein
VVSGDAVFSRINGRPAIRMEMEIMKSGDDDMEMSVACSQVCI